MNRKYYIVLPYQRKGPYNIEELKKQKITKDTLIWTFEINDPVKAGDLPELENVWAEIENNISNEDVPPPPSSSNVTGGSKKEEVSTEQPTETSETDKEDTSLFDDNDLPKFDDESTPPPLFKDEKTPVDEEPLQSPQQPEDNIIPPPIPQEKKETKTPSTPPPIIIQNSSQSNYYSEKVTSKENVHKKPNDYIIWSILSFIFCCNIFAIASFITGNQCKNKYIAGQYEDAEKLSKTTLIILITGIVLSILAWIIGILA